MDDPNAGNYLWVARIIKDETGEVVRESEPMPLRQADKVAAGMGRNLNWNAYSVAVVKAPKQEKPDAR